MPAERSRADLPDRVVLGVRPEALDGPTDDVTDTVSFTVSVKEQLGHTLLVYGDVGGTQAVASLDPHREVELDQQMRLAVNLQTLHVFDPDSLETLI